MYHIGDRVAHPMHGAGTICAIQEQRCGGERRSYYVLCLLCGGLRLMIPCDAWEKAGLRPVLSREAAGELVRRFALLDPGEQPNWNQRYRENMLRIRSGDPAEVPWWCAPWREGTSPASFPPGSGVCWPLPGISWPPSWLWRSTAGWRKPGSCWPPWSGNNNGLFVGPPRFFGGPALFSVIFHRRNGR